MLPDFNRLKVFYYIYTQQSSTEAAKILHITQSGVSQHLKKLEEELHAQLFTRVNRRLVPTAAGRKLYGIVEKFVDQLEAGLRDINEAFETPSGELRIGSPAEFGKTYLPRIMASFSRKYPAVTFHLELGDPMQLSQKVSQGDLDFAYIDILPIFMNKPEWEAAYSITPLVREEFVFACSRSYYETHVAGAEYDELTRLKYIGYKHDIALFQSWFKLHFGSAPSSLELSLVADDTTAIIAAIEADMGIGIVVSHLLSEQLAEGTIVPIRATERKLDNSIACVQFKKKAETVTETAFKEHMRTELSMVPDLEVLALR